MCHPPSSCFRQILRLVFYFKCLQRVSAVNCARRGWINVDVDTIACEECGARLLFSTPASWNHQQGIPLFLFI
jgi:hypothetical protein